MTDQQKPTLVAAHTRRMINLENRMNGFVVRCGGFNNMNPEQLELHSTLAAEWDLLKADRELAKFFDAGKMTLAEFNAKKRRKAR